MKQSDLFRHTSAKGTGEAGQTSTCLLHPDVREVLDKFDHLKTDEARAAFADRWLARIADRLDDTWVAVYELCALVRDRELFKDSGDLGRGKTFDTFEAYFEDLFGKPFAVWVELEATYQFVTRSCPEMLKGPLEAAQREWVTARERVVIAAETDDNGKVMPEGRPPKLAESASLSQDQRAKAKGISRDTQKKLDRLARERPDLLDLVKAGELSAHGACIQAGWIVLPTPFDIACREVVKMTDEDLGAFVEYLTSDDFRQDMAAYRAKHKE